MWREYTQIPEREEVVTLKEHSKKLIVIGLDGATWDLIKPWADQGKLPTFKKLMENGTWGRLESTIPPVTVPAWISFVTGKNPGKLGCYDFLVPTKSLDDVKPITIKNIQSKTFYEILYEKGKKCIIINLPGSYPPRIKEIVITSFLTQGDDFIFPPELVNEIPEFKNYRLVPDRSLYIKGKIMDYIDDIREIERIRFECAKKLFKKEWDFFFLLISGTDWIQHIMYDKLISGAIDDDTAPIKFYKEIDEYIGWFVDNTPPDVNILFMSDHGFKVYEKKFFGNEWLKREGFLKVEHRTKTRTPRHMSEKETQRAISKRMNIKLPIFLLKHLKLLGWIHPLYMKLKKIIPIEVQMDVVQPKVSETAAYVATHSGSNFISIYINDKKRFNNGNVEPASYENIRAEIIYKLTELKDPKTGKKIVEKIWKKEELYFGDKVNTAPDIIFKLSDEYHMGRLLVGEIFKDNMSISNHALYGIFLAYGPDIKESVKVENITIYDLAPTILHIFGLPIPSDIDGRVLKEIFKEESEFAKKEIVYQKADDRERIKEKIKELKIRNRI